ncbi:hypothetical protein [Gordonia rubripertincta]|uniref:hypothetical protein n=1 Tax=Gordonia rubripertincta TaxID=36822 RepID=UPI0015FB5840|nr:hypothetical protein [Gordonia rubripertincta]QMU19037.1 hypothetical protein H3V45_13045 [Gordonia rubripertincta]
MGQTLTNIVSRTVDLANADPDRAATVSAAYGGKAPHIVGGQPNTMIAEILELGPALERGLAWNVATASALLRSLNHHWATPRDVARAAWLDRVLDAEQSGKTRREAISAAGVVPR